MDRHVVALFEAAEAEDPELALFLVLAADAGARRVELPALRRTDFHLDGTVTVARAIVLGADGPVEKDPKNPDSVRTIALSARTAEWLAAHWRHCEERAHSCGTSVATDAFVFAALPGGSRPWRPDTWTHRFVRLRSTGPRHVRLHDLRHFVVTTLLAAGVPVSQLAGRVGHGGGGATTIAPGQAGDDKRLGKELATTSRDSTGTGRRGAPTTRRRSRVESRASGSQNVEVGALPYLMSPVAARRDVDLGTWNEVSR